MYLGEYNFTGSETSTTGARGGMSACNQFISLRGGSQQVDVAEEQTGSR